MMKHYSYLTHAYFIPYWTGFKKDMDDQHFYWYGFRNTTKNKEVKKRLFTY